MQNTIINKDKSACMRTLFIALIVIVSFDCMAQSAKTHGHNVSSKKGVEMLTSTLNLSNEQALALQKLEDSCVNRLKALGNLDRSTDERRTKLEALSLAREKTIQQIMTKEQYEKYVQMKEDAKRNAEEQRKKHMEKRLPKA